MEAIIVVLNKTDLLDELLTDFVAKDIRGATVIDSSGMGHLIANQFPMFSMFAEVGAEKEGNSKTIFTISDDENDRHLILQSLEEVVGDLSAPDTAILFTLPVNFSAGITF